MRCEYVKEIRVLDGWDEQTKGLYWLDVLSRDLALDL
jgi:hypothetical protein